MGYKLLGSISVGVENPAKTMLSSYFGPVCSLQQSKYPKTAATSDCLETFEKLSYIPKISAFGFYHTASWLTDDTGTKTLKVSLFLSIGPLSSKLIIT